METTAIEFEQFLNMFRNGICTKHSFVVLNHYYIYIYTSCLAKQNVDNSLQACVDRFWTEIMLNSNVFDRNLQEVGFC